MATALTTMAKTKSQTDFGSIFTSVPKFRPMNLRFKTHKYTKLFVSNYKLYTNICFFNVKKPLALLQRAKTKQKIKNQIT